MDWIVEPLKAFDGLSDPDVFSSSCTGGEVLNTCTCGGGLVKNCNCTAALTQGS